MRDLVLRLARAHRALLESDYASESHGGETWWRETGLAEDVAEVLGESWWEDWDERIARDAALDGLGAEAVADLWEGRVLEAPPLPGAPPSAADREVAVVLAAVGHPVGFDVCVFGDLLTIRTTDQGTFPRAEARQAAEFFVAKRREMRLGMDFEEEDCAHAERVVALPGEDSP